MVKQFDAPKPLSKVQERQKRTGHKGKTAPKRQMIPTLPKSVVDVAQLDKPNQRSIACVNMKLAGASFVAIAHELGYANAGEAERAYVSALATMYPVENWETLRQTEALRAELALNQAMAMASADYFVDVDDPTVMIPNTEKRLWHDQLLKAIALHSTITGAKAPSRVEMSVDVQELNAMAQLLLQGEGQHVQEASMWDRHDIPELEVLDAEVEEG